MRRGRTRAPKIVPADWAGEPELPGPGSRTLLLDFFSFGDPAGVLSLPRLRDLSETYREAGLTVLGVHVPAYDFERPLETARREMWRLGIPYAVALDHGMEVFRAYGLTDLPARVLVDGEGFVRAWEQGPGDLALMERALRSLLAEGAPQKPLPAALEPAYPVRGRGRLRWRPTPEIRFGTRGVGFGPPDGRDDAEGAVREFPLPPELRAEGMAYLQGAWTLGRERVTASEGGLSVVFEGSSVAAVVSPADPESEPPLLRVTLDGAAPADGIAGCDLDREGDTAIVTIDRGGLYELVSSTEFGTHHLDLRIDGTGVAVHLLHFGTTDVPEVA